MTDAQKETLTKLVELYRLAQWDEVTLTADHADAIDAALAEIDRLRAEREATRELLVRADSYLSLLWHRHVAPERKDADLSFNVGRTIGDLRVKSETP